MTDDDTLYWLIKDYILSVHYVLCVRSPNRQIPLPLDEQLNCIRGLSADEKKILHQKITQAVENYQYHLMSDSVA